jgi:hypothetical protein
MVRDVNREPLTDFYALVRLPCVRSEVSPLRRSGTLIAIWVKLRISSWCTKMLIALRGSRDLALKADCSLINSIIKLKADCPEIQEHLYISQYDSLIDTNHMCLQRLPFWHRSGGCPILSWGKASDQIRNASSLFWDLLFLLLDWRVPLICVTESGIPNSERDRLSV